MTVLRNRLLVRVTAPAIEPITLSEAKLYLRIDHANEDVLISDLIVAARLTAEHWLKRSLITQAWKLAYDDYAAETLSLPMGPVNSITSIMIVNRDNSTQVIDNSVYYLNAAKDTLIFDMALIGFRVEITYSTGYGNAAAVPKAIKQGMLVHIASMYENRGEACEYSIPDQTIRLYTPFREICL